MRRQIRLMATLDEKTINSFENDCNSVEISDSLTLSEKNKDICLAEDSIDGLQWCTEVDYQYKSDQRSSHCHSVPKSIFESSLLSSSNSYATPPTSNYTDVSNNLDANLAQIDIETFRSEDINAVFLQQAGEDCASLSTSMFEDSISLDSYRSIGGAEEHNKRTQDMTEEAMIGTNLDKIKQKSVFNDISVDSLDQSLYEKNTSKLLLKCTERGEKNYTIAFEGSVNGSQDLNGLQRIYSNRSGYLGSDYMTNEVNDRKMTKSVNLFRSLHKSRISDRINRNVDHKSDRLVQEIDKTIEKLTQSIPDMKCLAKMNEEYKMPFCPVSGFLPLYDLQSSQSSNSQSSGSEFSPPRSLIKMFMQNRSPLPSEQTSPSLSYECRSPEWVAGNTCDSYGLKHIYSNILESSRETNNNILSENRTQRISSNEDQMTAFDHNFGRNPLRIESQRLQTFPIKEVDENMSDSFSTDILMNSVDINEINANISDLNKNPLNLYPNNQNSNNISKESHVSVNPSEKYSFCSLNRNLFQNISNTNRSGIQFNPSISAQNISGQNQRQEQPIYSSRVNTQTTNFSHNINNKEVQTSMASEGGFERLLRQNPNQTPTNRSVLTPESPIDSIKPFYIYYPNYSLPDLSFLEQILQESSLSVPKAVYLSPTKHHLPNKDPVSVKMRSTSKSGRRPKSFTDFESLSKQNFSHIKDWDSLNILLPTEFKELFQKTNNVSKAKNERVVESKNMNSNVFNDHDFNTNSSYVRMRSHRSNGQLSNNHIQNKGFSRNKRYSLQEYPFSQFDELKTEDNNHETVDSWVPSMSRSNTMPNCHNSCHCHQHCCHNCCHSCCRTPRQVPSADIPMGQTSNGDLNTSSIDKLCQLLAMDLSFKRLMNIINGQNISNNGLNAERVDEEVNQMNNNNKFVEQFKQNQTIDGLHVKQLKQRWESLANVDPIDVKANTSSNLKNGSNDGIKAKTKSIDPNKRSAKTESSKKPKVVLRRPLSSIPRPTSLNTEIGAYSQRKSMIPVPKTIRSPVRYGSKVKSNAFKS